jgi:phosphopantothenoylcysteine decarboxylase/phosphopantothenate--cysteine ligase
MRFLITAGGTREYLDPVRFISNASSGKMGYALARAALKAGHEVTLITAPTALYPPRGAKIIHVENAAQMFAAVKERFARCDCLIMAAAVADYTPVRPSKAKLRKQATKLTLELKPTPDILRWAGRRKKPGQMLVGFALEDRNLRANAERKMREKHLDMVVANAPGSIGADRSTLYVKTIDSDWFEINDTYKTASARRVIRVIERFASNGRWEVRK